MALIINVSELRIVNSDIHFLSFSHRVGLQMFTWATLAPALELDRPSSPSLAS